MKKFFLHAFIILGIINVNIKMVDCQNSNFQENQKKIEKEILQLMKNFISDDPTEKEQMEAQRKIVEDFGFQAFPYLLEGIKSENEKIRYYSFITISEVISHRIRCEEKEPGKTDVFTLSLSSEEKIWVQQVVQMIYSSLKDPSLRVREVAIHILGVLGRQDAVPILEKLLTDNEPRIRYRAVLSLRALGHWEYDLIKVMTGKEPKTPEEYVEFLDDTRWGEWGLFIPAIEKLKKFGKEAIPALIKVASSEKEPARTRAIDLLGELKAEEAIPIFENYLKQDATDETIIYVQSCCLSALNDISTPKSIELLKKYGLNHKEEHIRLNVAEILLEKERDTALSFLIKMAKEGNGDTKERVAYILIKHKEKECIPILIELLKDRFKSGWAREWLEKITRQRFGRLPPVVTNKMLDEYVNKWQSWWEKNKDTFKFFLGSVLLDPGHGGEDPGAIGPTGLKEKDVNLDIALRLRDLLKNAGVKVYMTRETDETLSLEERNLVTVHIKPTFFISIHNNASVDSSMRGTETYIFDFCYSHGIELTLGVEIQKEVHNVVLENDRGVKMANYQVLRHDLNGDTNGTLCKVTFITNPESENRLKQEKFRQSVAEAMKKAILKALTKNFY